MNNLFSIFNLLSPDTIASINYCTDIRGTWESGYSNHQHYTIRSYDRKETLHALLQYRQIARRNRVDVLVDVCGVGYIYPIGRFDSTGKPLGELAKIISATIFFIGRDYDCPMCGTYSEEEPLKRYDFVGVIPDREWREIHKCPKCGTHYEFINGDS